MLIKVGIFSNWRAPIDEEFRGLNHSFASATVFDHECKGFETRSESVSGGYHLPTGCHSSIGSHGLGLVVQRQVKVSRFTTWAQRVQRHPTILGGKKWWMMRVMNLIMVYPID